MKNKYLMVRRVLTIILLLFLCFNFNSISYANTNEDIDMAINNEEAGLFESTIASVIGGIAKAVFNIATSDTVHLGFKNYDELVFNKNMDSMAPFDNETWNKTMTWYNSFTLIAFVPILIAVIVTSYKIMITGGSTSKKNEAKESLLRLLFGGTAIAVAPLFIKILLYLNASLVNALVSISAGGLDSLLGNGVFTQIKTGSAIATALVICLFAYLFVKINIKFIIRKFTLIVFTVFTPIVAGLWMINKNVTAASIWFGQIIINVFMQFIYSFLFLLYMSFTSVSDGWAVSLLWAMMIMPLGDSLLNMMQNLVSRIAGVNNEEIANRGIGLGATMAFTVKSITSQVKDTVSSSSQNGVINRLTNRNNSSSTTQTNNSNESKSTNINNITNKSVNNESINKNNNSNDSKKIPIPSLYGIGRNIMNTGMYMAEGRNFSNNNQINNRRNYGMNMRRNEQESNVANNIRKERFVRNEQNDNKED